jgi:hypothetical protein
MWIERLLVPAAFIRIIVGSGTVEGQSRPAGEDGRIWLSFGVGTGHARHACVSCGTDSRTGGLASTAAAGLSFPRRVGLALAYYGFARVVLFEGESQSSRHSVVLAQYSPRPTLTLNLGYGSGKYTGSPFGELVSRSGKVAALGVAARIPAESFAAASLSAMYFYSLKALHVEDASPLGSRAVRPHTILVTASLSLAPRPPR